MTSDSHVTPRHAECPRDTDRVRLRIGQYERKIRERLAEWTAAGIQDRLWRKDQKIWFDESQDEIIDRLGWLNAPRVSRKQLRRFTEFAKRVHDESFRHIVLLGMGGSSLAPEVFAKTLPLSPGFPEFAVLDSTHPAAVHAATESLDLRRCLFIISSKSGTTLETRSLFQHFWAKVNEVPGIRPGNRFIAVTDPESPLETVARERNFRAIFHAQPDLGGRYSALSDFGIVPGASMGASIQTLLDRAMVASEQCNSCRNVSDAAGIMLGAVLGELALAGRDKLTFMTTASLAALPDWIEQLIAESTGKSGKGILPVVSEPELPARSYGEDRLFVAFVLAGEPATQLDYRLNLLTNAGHPVVRIELPDLLDLGAEMFHWEVAVSLAGALLGIHPFNQPDVQLAKDLTRQAMESETAKAGATDGVLVVSNRASLAEQLQRWLGDVRRGGYIAVQAYLAPTKETTAGLQEIRSVLSEKTSLATTIGYGPRFLHSTGQLHKGGPDTGLFLQIVDAATVNDLPVPETDYTFGRLIEGQAQGDAKALQERGRSVLRLNVGRNPVRGVRAVADMLQNNG